MELDSYPNFCDLFSIYNKSSILRVQCFCSHPEISATPIYILLQVCSFSLVVNKKKLWQFSVNGLSKIHLITVVHILMKKTIMDWSKYCGNNKKNSSNSISKFQKEYEVLFFHIFFFFNFVLNYHICWCWRFIFCIKTCFWWIFIAFQPDPQIFATWFPIFNNNNTLNTMLYLKYLFKKCITG